MTACIFVGPTLSASDVCAEIEAAILPPAAEGDVYRVALDKPRAIGIIDGHCERVPSVTHKEILWAMSQGIHVFGSAGMGALRAVELAPFGMEGVGDIYQAFASGELEDDDEVVVACGSPDEGYPALSEALVDIRSTLQAAEDHGALSPTARERLEDLAKGLHYTQRSYSALLEHAGSSDVSASEVGALREFLSQGRARQKRKDALAMLAVMRERLGQGLRPKQVKYSLEHTEGWEALRRRIGKRSNTCGPQIGLSELESLIEEVQLAGVLGEVALGATVRALAIEAARRAGRVAHGAALQEAIDQFRRERSLLSPAHVQRWLDEHQIDDAERFFQDESHVRWAETTFAAERERCFFDYLRSTGDYGPLLARARHKQQALEERQLAEPCLDALEISEEALWCWYFEQHLGRAVPANLASYARANGFSGVRDLLRAVMRELAFARAGEQASP
jgi:hypothetical protein